MRLADIYPARGMFTPGEQVTLIAEVETESPAPAFIRLNVLHFEDTIATLLCPVSLSPDRGQVRLTWQAPPHAPRGYGIKAQLLDEKGAVCDEASTAFDILPHWTSFPRYGFLTDFSPTRTDAAAALDSLACYHLNGLQFYDWQYRHDCLLPPSIGYLDPLGRPLSLDTVREFIQEAHTHGMAAMPYLAVYAASADFWRAHPQWALYDSGGKPIPFGENFLGLMNPAPGGTWARHLLNECDRVLSWLPFDGLHIDQYGDPKAAFDAAGHPVDLPAAFAGFISTFKAAHPQAVAVFNAVGNWPIEALAASPQDFAYIEVWPPATAYRDLQQIVTQARALSGGKPAVIALYLPADRPVNVRLADAVIYSCGGSRIELGERERLLADPYFPRHQALPPELKTILRRYSDFAVRYGELLGPMASDSTEPLVQTLPGVWATIRRSPGWLTICLINVTGLGDPRWDEAHPAPTPLVNISLRVAMPGATIRQAWSASPDQEQLELSAVAWTAIAGAIEITLPTLDYWTIVAFKLDSQN